MLIGVIGFSIYPYHMYFHYSVPVASDHLWLLHLAYVLWPVWAAAVAWGLATLRAGTIRSLTPPFAALAVVFPLVPAAIESFRRPITDAGATPYIRNWEPPAGPLDVLARSLAEHPFILLGSTLFLLLGVAWARGQRRWFAAGLIALPVYGGIHDVVEPAISVGFLLSPLRAAIPGAILFYVGYRLAARREPSDSVDPTAESGLHAASN